MDQPSLPRDRQPGTGTDRSTASEQTDADGPATDAAPETTAADTAHTNADDGHPTGIKTDAIERTEVRRYPDEPVMSAYHDGDDHLVVIHRERTDDIDVKRVPATRTAVCKGERLWTLPSNWEERVRIREDPADCLVCYIPETTVEVVVRLSGANHLPEAPYRVEKVGTLRTEPAGPYRRQLRNISKQIDSKEDIPEHVLDAICALNSNWQTFKSKYTRYFNKWGDEAVWRRFKQHDVATVDDWRMNPWEDEQDVTHLIGETIDVDSETLAELVSFLIAHDVVTPYPDIKLTFSERDSLPLGYDVQALIEAGCSPAEAVDYIHAELRGESITPWARVRDVSEATITENLAAVNDRLDR